MSSWSIRNRLFIVIAGMALLASISIGAAYLATEGERVAVRADAHTVASLYNLTVGLSNAVRDQEAAIDDYLLSGNAAADTRYDAALENQLSISAQMRLQAGAYPGIEAAVATVTGATADWRASFAQPAISAVERASAADVSRIAAESATDQQSTLTGVADLITQISAAEASVSARDDAVTQTRAAAGVLGILLMLVSAAASLVLARRWVARPLGRLLTTASDVEAGANVEFVNDRDDEIGHLGQALERMRFALQQDVDQSSVLNRFTEVTTFAPDDAAVAAASLEALEPLVQPDAAVAHVLNRSKDRALPEATVGSAIAEILPLNALSRCPAIVRGHLRDLGRGRAAERPLHGLPG